MQKKCLSVYIIYVVLCLVICIYQSSQNVPQVKTEKFGLSRDNTVELNEDSEVAVEFQLTHDRFDGINVKFQSDSKFGNELISAVLTDAEDGTVLAECRIDLKYERIQNKDSGSDIFFPLPLENAENRKVRLTFSLEGDEIYVYPKFVTSESEVVHSELFINGEASNEALVFSARYDLESSGALAEAIMNGVFLILSGSFVFYCVYSKNCGNKADSSIWVKDCSGWNRRNKMFLTYVRRYRIPVGYLFMILVLSILYVYVYQFSVEKTIYKCSVSDVIRQDGEEDYVCIDAETQGLEQVFVCESDNLSGIILRFIPNTVSENAAVCVIIKDDTTGQVLADQSYRLNDLFRENMENRCYVSLSETLEKSKNHSIRICIAQSSFENTTIRIPVGIPDVVTNKKGNKEHATMYLNGDVSEQNIAVTAEFGNVSFLNSLYIILCVLLTITATIVYFGCFAWKWRTEKILAVMIMLYGIVFGCVIGLYTVPDEPSHIDTAYSISNEVIGISASTRPGYLYKRMEDVDMAAEEKQSLNVYSYERLYRQLFTKAGDETLVECAGRNNLGNASRIYYLPQAAGILLGRFLDLGMMPTMMLGRFCSLICYAVLAYLAMKKMPFGKISLFLIGILPITLQQAASFSYDAMINGAAFVYLSYCLSAIYGDSPIKVRDIGIMLVTGIMMAMVKGGVYVAVCMLPLMILVKRKDIAWKYRKCMIGIAGIYLFAFAKNNLVRTVRSFMAQQGTVSGGSSSTEVYTFGYILENPLRFLGMFVNTLYKQGDSYLRNLLGGNLAWREINISWSIIFCFLLLILLSCVVREKEKRVSTGDRIYLTGISFGAFFCIELSMFLVWTPVTLDYITGVQGRYFLPFFLLILIAVRNSFIKISQNIDRFIIFAGAMLNTLTILQVIQKAIG